jgi:hypothetical protein
MSDRIVVSLLLRSQVVAVEVPAVYEAALLQSQFDWDERNLEEPFAVLDLLTPV